MHTHKLFYRMFSYETVLNLLSEVQKQFPQISRVKSIGKSYQQRDMLVLTLGSQIAVNERNRNEQNPPGILLTSVHHAREVLGVTLNVYIVLRLIHGYQHQDQSVITLLKNHNIYSLPFVNIDGYAKISETWENSHVFDYVRKNMRPLQGCSGNSIGVDLNRNYDYKWGLDNIGSTNRKCEEDYRGESAFSEPETQAVRDFVISTNTNIKITINFHTWGNLFIIPYNYDNRNNHELIGTPIYKMYEDIRDSKTLPEGILFGNGMQTIKYTANGDATDWMSKQNGGVVSISPELGTKDHHTDKFFPDQKYVKDIIEQNYKWINYTMYKLSSQVEIRVSRFSKIECEEGQCGEEGYQTFEFEIEVENLGFTTTSPGNFNLTIDEDVEVYKTDEPDEIYDTETVLNYKSLESLEKQLISFKARITNEKWEKMNMESTLNGSIKKPIITIQNSKYPHFESSQKNVRILSRGSILSAESGDFDEFEEVPPPSSTTYYLFALLLCVVIIVAVVIFCYNRNKDKLMVKLEDQIGKEIEMGNRNSDLENEDMDIKEMK